MSCNVHTQARDVGWLVRGEEDGKGDGEVGEGEKEVGDGGKKVGGGVRRARYRIESIQGFDFFPQTSHVEGVAILEKVDD